MLQLHLEFIKTNTTCIVSFVGFSTSLERSLTVFPLSQSTFSHVYSLCQKNLPFARSMTWYKCRSFYQSTGVRFKVRFKDLIALPFSSITKEIWLLSSSSSSWELVMFRNSSGSAPWQSSPLWTKESACCFSTRSFNYLAKETRDLIFRCTKWLFFC